MKKVSNIVFSSICTVNFISYVATLSASLKKYHPNIAHYVLVVDYDDKYEKLLNKFNFKVIRLKQLSIPNVKSLIKKYNAFELSNILKPFFFEWLLKTQKIELLFYFDSDIQIFSSLKDVVKFLKKSKYSIALTPHNICIDKTSINDYKIEKLILLSGLYNGGFYAFKNDKNSLRFLEWHKNKLKKYGFNAPQVNMFVDQKILDLAPILFDFVGIYKNETYNLGHWNYKYYNLQNINSEYLINGKKLVFFHFSQIIFRKPIRNSIIFGKSIKKNIFLQKLIYEYWQALINNGYNETRLIKYGYEKYYNEPSLSQINPIAYKDSQISSLTNNLNLMTQKNSNLEKSNEYLININDSLNKELNKLHTSKYYRFRILLFKIKSLISI